MSSWKIWKYCYIKLSMMLCCASFPCAAQSSDPAAEALAACRVELARLEISVPICGIALRSEGFCAFVGEGLTRALDSLHLRDSLRIYLDSSRIYMSHQGPKYPLPWDMEERWGIFLEAVDMDEGFLRPIIDSLFSIPLFIRVTHHNEWEIEARPEAEPLDPVEFLFSIIKPKGPLVLGVTRVQPKNKAITNAVSIPVWECITTTLRDQGIVEASTAIGSNRFIFESTGKRELDSRYIYEYRYLIELSDVYKNDPTYAGRFANIQVLRKWKRRTGHGEWQPINVEEGGPRVEKLLWDLRTSVENCGL